MTIFLAVLAAALTVALVPTVWGTVRNGYRTRRRSTVIVNLTTGTVFRGVLWSTDRDLLVLRGAQILHQGEGQPVDGEVIVERDAVEFVQRVS